MAASLEIRLKQRAVVEFLVAERETLVNIHEGLQRVYHDEALGDSNVRRWASRFAKDSDEYQPVTIGGKKFWVFNSKFISSFIFVHELIAHPVCAYKIMSIRIGGI